MKVISGCIASACYFALVLLFMFESMMGDCFERIGHPCPTDHERNVRVLVILAVGVVAYGIVGFAIARLSKRRDDNSN